MVTLLYVRKHVGWILSLCSTEGNVICPSLCKFYLFLIRQVSDDLAPVSGNFQESVCIKLQTQSVSKSLHIKNTILTEGEEMISLIHNGIVLTENTRSIQY